MAKNDEPLLVVEDDADLCNQLHRCFRGYRVLSAGDAAQATEAMRAIEPPVVLFDLGLSAGRGGVEQRVAALGELLRRWPRTKVVVIAAGDEREYALKAVDDGAYDFCEKPLDAEAVRLVVARARRLHQIEEENRRLVRTSFTPLPGIIAASPAMLEVCRLIERLARVGATVLLQGESGTGKEVLARALHALGPRADRRFVAINCASIPESLLESELFGYERGAFTGAVRRTTGRIEYADGGTLFLDEVADLPLPLQAKLLRFLQERVVERLGGRGEIPVDVRVVAATHDDLESMIAAGTFREDLYYRLCEISVRIPPLRERSGDAALLAHALLRQYARSDGRAVTGFTVDALAAIDAYGWPGNVRELENVVHRAVILAEDREVSATHLGLDAAGDGAGRPLRLREARNEAERATVARALGLANGNIVRAAELLGVSRPTVYALLNKFGMRAGCE